MKFNHVVSYNGIYYAAGEEVPIPEEAKEPQETSEPKEEVATAQKRRGRKPREV